MKETDENSNIEENKTGTEAEKAECPFDLFRFGRHFIIKPLRKYYDKLLPFYNKISAEKWSYLFFGALTTVVSLVSFFICDKAFHLHEQICNAISFALAVAFAFFVNKYFVFNSRKKGLAAFYEALKFIGSRLASYGIEIAIIAIFVTWLKFDASLIKFIAQVIVFILNYIFSKLIVFTHKKGKKDPE